MLDQDALNKEQQARIDHLEKLFEYLVERVTNAEDKANKPEATTSRSTRSKPTQVPAQLTNQMKELEERTSKCQDRLQQVENIVEQLNDSST